MGPRRALALGAILLLLGPGCRKRERPEAARARATAAFLTTQIAGLKDLLARAEKGELVTKDQLAIGISEDVVKSLFNASLPQETVIAQRLRVRIESALPAFRGSQAALLFRARVSSEDIPSAFASVELAGRLDQFRLQDGRLFSRVALEHFSVLEASVGELAADMLDNVVKDHLDVIQGAIPEVEIPVRFEQAININGLDEGPVVAKPGTLPLQISVAQVIPVNERLWVLVDAKAGPWQPAASKPK